MDLLQEAAGLPSFIHLPFRQNAFFCQRDKDLQQLSQAFGHDQKSFVGSSVPHIQAITGLGGIGKSQLARQYAYSFAQDYHCVFWIDASSRQSLLEDFRTLAVLIKCTENQANVPQAQTAEERSHSILVEHVKKRLAQHLPSLKPWLLVFDNANDFENLEPFLPAQGCGHLLLTSRNANADAVGIASPLAIEIWTPTQGSHFLSQRLGRQGLFSATDQNVLEEISHEVGGLPLALEQVGAYLTANRSDPSIYLNTFRQKRLRLLERSKVSGASYSSTVGTTWILNFDQVRSQSLASSELFYALAFFSESAVPLSIFIHFDTRWGAFSNVIAQEESIERRELLLDEVLSPLLSYSLIERVSGEKSCRVHPLVQEVMRSTLSFEDRKNWAERVVRNLVTSFAQGQFRTWEQSKSILPHVMAVSRWIQEFDFQWLEAVDFLVHAANHLIHDNAFIDALKLIEQALDLIEILEEGSVKELKRATALSVRGDLHRATGQMHLAETDLLKSWEKRRQFTNKKSPDVALVAAKLADLYLLLRRDKLADEFSSEALAIYRDWYTSHMEEARHSLIKLVNLRGRFHCEMSQWEAAQLLLEEQLRLLDEAGQGDSVSCAEVWGLLAAIAEKVGELDRAEELYDKALPLLRLHFGEESSKVAVYNSNLAGLFCRRGDFGRAEKPCRDAVLIQQKTYGPDHPNLVAATGNLAVVLTNLGRLEEAEAWHKHSLDLARRILPVDHPGVTGAMKNYAVFLRVKGEIPRAEIFENEVARLKLAHDINVGFETVESKKELLQIEVKIEQQRLTFGAKHPATLLSQTQHAQKLQKQFRLVESKSELEYLLPLWAEVHGERSHNVAAILGDLCAIYVGLGETQKALEHGRKSLSIREELQETSDIHFANFLGNYSFALQAGGQIEISEQVFERAIQTQQAIKGEDFPGLVPLLRKLGCLQMDRAALLASEEVILKIVQIQEGRWGKDHLGITGDLESLALHYEFTGREELAQDIRERIANIKNLFKDDKETQDQVKKGWRNENIPVGGLLTPPPLLMLQDDLRTN